MLLLVCWIPEEDDIDNGDTDIICVGCTDDVTAMNDGVFDMIILFDIMRTNCFVELQMAMPNPATALAKLF